MKFPDVSFVIPTRDRPGYLAEAVSSILAQTLPAREIIIVDNGSRPSAAENLARFGDSVRVVRSQPGAVQVARNTGFREAFGTWVATLDDDDIVHPTYLEEAMPLLLDDSVDIVSTDHRKFRGGVYEDETNFEQAPPGYWDFADRSGDHAIIGKFPLPNLLKRIPVYPSTTIIRRDFALAIGGYDPAMRGIPAEDIEFLVRALTYGRLGLVWKALVGYRLHAGNNTASVTGRTIGRWRIFEFVRRTHKDLPNDFLKALDIDLPERRAEIYRTAFRIGDRSLMREIAPLLRASDWTPGMVARNLISHAPAHLGRRMRFGAGI